MLGVLNGITVGACIVHTYTYRTLSWWIWEAILWQVCGTFKFSFTRQEGKAADNAKDLEILWYITLVKIMKTNQHVIKYMWTLLHRTGYKPFKRLTSGRCPGSNYLISIILIFVTNIYHTFYDVNALFILNITWGFHWEVHTAQVKQQQRYMWM